jgi:dienelactone hydrolase
VAHRSPLLGISRGASGYWFGVRRVKFALVLALTLAAASCGGTGASPTARPAHAPANDTHWFKHSAPDGTHVLVGIIHAPASFSGPRPSVLLVPGTDGLNVDYDVFGHQLAQVGFNVAIGCWFADAPTSPTSPLIGCAGGPKFKGVTESAVGDLDALVAAAKDALRTDQIALVGFSRGGGIVMLRAADGASEPVISIAGMLEGWTNIGTAPGEVNIVQRAQDIHAPVLLLHGDSDPAVPVEQAQHMEAALRAHHDDVTAKYYPGEGHGLATDPPTRADLIAQITGFLCGHQLCPSSKT